MDNKDHSQEVLHLVVYLHTETWCTVHTTSSSSHCVSPCPECTKYYIHCDVHLKVLPHEAFRTVKVSCVSFRCDGEDSVLQHHFSLLCSLAKNRCEHLMCSEYCSNTPKHLLKFRDKITLVYDNTATGRVAWSRRQSGDAFLKVRYNLYWNV